MIGFTAPACDDLNWKRWVTNDDYIGWGLFIEYKSMRRISVVTLN